jgi:hypothetical protein
MARLATWISTMIKEYVFKNPPKGQIKLERVSGANPEF